MRHAGSGQTLLRICNQEEPTRNNRNTERRNQVDHRRDGFLPQCAALQSHDGLARSSHDLVSACAELIDAVSWVPSLTRYQKE